MKDVERHQQWLTGTKDVSATTLSESLGRRRPILVDLKWAFEHLIRFVIQRDKTILCIQHLTDRLVNTLQKLIEIRSVIQAVDDFRNHRALSLRTLTARDVACDSLYPNRYAVLIIEA